jgi:polyhydroxyalkanoate synthesis regulator protein
MQEQVRKNFATFEKALGLFTPFAPGPSEGNNEDGAASQHGLAEGRDKKPGEDEIATLKAELSAMQERLDQLSRRQD